MRRLGFAGRRLPPALATRHLAVNLYWRDSPGRVPDLPKRIPLFILPTFPRYPPARFSRTCIGRARLRRAATQNEHVFFRGAHTLRVLRQAGPDHSWLVFPSSFVIRHSCFVIHRPKMCTVEDHAISKRGAIIFLNNPLPHLVHLQSIDSSLASR